MSATLTAVRPSVHEVTDLTTPEQVLVDASIKQAKAQSKLDYAIAMVKRAMRWAADKGLAIWNRVKAFALKYSSFAAIGSGIILATKAGYRAVASVAVDAVGWVSKATIKVGGWLSSLGHFLGRGVAKMVGMVSKSAGAKVTEWNDKVHAWVGEKLASAKQYVEHTVLVVKNILTADSTTTVVNVGAGIMAGAVAANVVSGGSIALSAAGIPAIGAALAGVVAGGPLFWLALPALIGAGVAYTLFFKKDELPKVEETAAVQEMVEAVAEAQVIIDEAEVTELTADLLVKAASEAAAGKHAAGKQHGRKS
jgi:hypothetical protein